MEITFLGSGNAFMAERECGCILVNDNIMLDAGPGALLSLKRLHKDTAKISHIFLSHFHADHSFGLPFLLLEWMFIARSEAPLAIIGPAGVEERVHTIMELAYPEIMAMGWPRPMIFHEVNPGVPDSVAGVEFTAIQVEHGAPYQTCYGYRLHTPEGVLAYTGDTHYCQAVQELAAGARAIIIETDSHPTSPVHIGMEDLHTFLATVPAETTVFLNHLDTTDVGKWAGLDVTVAEDLRGYVVE